MIIFSLAIISLMLFPQLQEKAFSQSIGLGAPAYGADGRLALSLNGNIWELQIIDSLIFDDATKSTDGNWVQITKGPAEDRDPAWTPDSRTLIFASDRAGSFDLWKLKFGTAGGNQELQRISFSEEPDTEPCIATNGDIVWVRGFGPDADLWIKKPGSDEKPLTSKLGAEYSPAFSPDGTSIAYIAERKGRKQLRILSLRDQSDTLVVGDLSPEYPSWSPDGNRIVFSKRGNKPGIYITTQDGRYSNLVSTKRGVAAWSPNGEFLVLVDLPRTGPGYNGDPGELGTRHYDSPLAVNQVLTFVPAPPPPDSESANVPINAQINNSEGYLERFDRVATYLTKRYNFDQGPTNSQWESLITKYRDQVQTAKDEAAVEEAIYKLLRDRPLLRSEAVGKAVVSSAHTLATAAGLEVLGKGGNVVDAAIAVSFALGVVEPDASGLGGYGEMLIFLNGMDAPICIEFLTRVPEAASLTNGALVTLPRDGPVLVNVPGTLAGMELAWQRYGSKKVEWQQLVEPSIKLASEGFTLDDAFPTTLAREKERYLQYKSSSALFFPNGNPLQPGDTLRNPDLAWTLSQIAKEGSKAFYKGEIAKRMVEDLSGKGNVMTLADMARYYAVEREPVTTTYRNHTVYSGPPPVSGGVTLVGKLNLLEQYRNPGSFRDDFKTLHSMIEAWKLSPSTRGRIADPGLWPVDISPFTDKQLAKERWQSCFDLNHSITPENSACLKENVIAACWGADDVLDTRTSTGTTAFVVVDAEGNMVSVTQTLGTWGGNFYVTPGLGFIYNDKLRSYRTKAKDYNARVPFARNVTSISPTIVFKGTGEKKRPYLAVGAAGNAWITSAVYQIVAGIIDQGLGPQQAIEQPRFLVGVRRDPKNRDIVREIVVQLEDGFAPGILSQLHKMGHDLQRISMRGELRMGYASAAIIDGKQARAGADPRRSGKAGAVK